MAFIELDIKAIIITDVNGYLLKYFIIYHDNVISALTQIDMAKNQSLPKIFELN